MKLKTSKLNSEIHYASVTLDVGNNPKQSDLYTLIADQLFNSDYDVELNDELCVLIDHNFSHITGKIKQWFSVYDLNDFYDIR